MKAKRASSAGDLEISEDLEFQRQSWFWERVGQLAVGLLVLAALIGVFGGGPVSISRPTSPSGALRLEYPRFVRNQSAYTVTIHVSPKFVRDGAVQVSVDAALIGALADIAISPEPESVELGQQRLLYTFRVGASESLAPIVIDATANAIGVEGGAIGVVGGESINLRSFVYP